MKRALALLLIATLAAALAGCATPAAQAQTRGDLAVTLAAEPGTPLVDRPVTVALTVTRGGAPLAGARVTLGRAMAGMEHHGDDGQAVAEDLGGGRYKALTTFSMGGAWDVLVSVDGGEPIPFRVEVEQP